MMYWNTGDKVVDAILRKLEGFSRWREDSDGEQTHQLLSALIDIEKMLPTAVARHFKLPYLFVGNAHFSNGPDYRRRLIIEITDALRKGLETASNDPLLRHESNTDFSDRPRSRGEVILEAIDDFKKSGSQASLSQLKLAIFPTRLHGRMHIIEMLTTRKCPYGNQSPEVAMLRELQGLEFEAEGYHGEKA